MVRFKEFCYDKRWVLFFIFSLLILEPILSTPWLGDDQFVHLQYLEKNNYSFRILFENILISFKSFMREQGRFPTQVFYSHVVFFLFRNRILYKLFLIAGTMGCMCLTGKIAELITKDPSDKFIVGLLSIACFQFYQEHNSLIQYFLLAQIVLILSEISLILFFNYLCQGKRLQLILSILMWIWALSIYEVAYPLVFLFIIVGIISVNSNWKGIKVALPYIFIVCIFAFLNVVVRCIYPPVTGGASFGLNFFKIIRAFLIQVVAAIPLSEHIWSSGNFVINCTFSDILKSISLIDLFIAIIYVVIISVFSRGKGITERKQYIQLLIIGSVIWLMPAAMISLSSQYQDWLRLGKGYLPVVIEYFGASLVGFSLYNIFLSRISSIKIEKMINFFSYAILLLIILVIRQDQRLYLESEYINTDKYTMDVIDEAVELFTNRCGSDISIYKYSDNDYSLNWSRFYVEYYGLGGRQKLIDNFKIEDDSRNVDIYELQEDIFELNYLNCDKTSTVTFSDLDYCIYNKQNNYIIQRLSKKIYVFFPREASYSHIEYNVYDPNSMTFIEKKSLRVSGLSKVDETRKGYLYLLESDFMIDIASISFVNKELNSEMVENCHVYFESGFEEIQNLAGYTNRWCKGEGTIIITNLDSILSEVEIRFGVTLQDPEKNISIVVNDEEFLVGEMSGICKQISLKPGINVIHISTSEMDKFGMINFQIVGISDDETVSHEYSAKDLFNMSNSENVDIYSNLLVMNTNAVLNGNYMYIPAGEYDLIIYGENIEDIYSDIFDNVTGEVCEYQNIIKTDRCVRGHFMIEEGVDSVEIRLMNSTSNIMKVRSIVILPNFY